MSDNEMPNSDTNSTSELQKLFDQRETIVLKLTRFVTFTKNAVDTDLLELESRLEHIPAVLHQFESVQCRIEMLDKSEMNSPDREIFENSYFKGISKARDVIMNIHGSRAARANQRAQVNINQSSQCIPTRITLPPIDLPSFEGDYKKWLFFHQRFEALVDKNEHLTNVEKFYHLQGRLKGEAQEVIQDLELTDKNYFTALKLLKDRYENKRVIIDRHVDDLFQIPGATKESHVQLRKLIDSFKQHIRSLKALGEPTDSWDRLLTQLLKMKLDTRTRERWQEFSHTPVKKEPPTLTEFFDFLVSRCEFLESKEKTNNSLQSLTHSKSFTQNTQSPSYSNRIKSEACSNVSVTDNIHCVFCKEVDHYIYTCKKFLNLSVASRRNEINKNKLCFNCLRENHTAVKCTRGVCKVCQGKHNTLLHIDNVKHQNNEQTMDNSSTKGTHLSLMHNADIGDNNACTEPLHEPNSSTIIAHSVNREFSQNTILSTVCLYVQDRFGNLIKARALLDSGSQSNIITKSLVEKLGLTAQAINIPLIGVNQSTTNISEQVNVCIKSRVTAYEEKLTFLILKQITGNIPNFILNRSTLDIPLDLKLADPNFDQIDQIDLLIGAGIFWDLLCIGQFKLGKKQPVLQKTKLGWIISGPINNRNLKHNACAEANTSSNLITFAALSDQIEAFWILEECPSIKRRTIEEIQCEEQFLKTMKRGARGRFIATLPIRQNVGDLGKSDESALKRFYRLENKLSKDPSMYSLYIHFMREYEQLGHMSKLSNLEAGFNKNAYYLPHHGVFKKDSITTKLRVVFDASAKSDNGISLNDKLMVGPIIQQDLFSIMVRFRQHNYALVADVTKMYRQIEITESQRNLQRIFWRENSNLPLSCYTLNTLTYGTASASFIAIRCLHQLAIENKDKYPLAAKVIETDFYVDDLITGSDTLQNAQTLKREITKILETGCFPLRKWKTNEQKILTDVVTDIVNVPNHYLLTESESKMLGVIWNSELDILTFKINSSTKSSITKRTILSLIAQIFDPLGLVGPVITKAKIIMQKLWGLQISWDEPVPSSLAEEFIGLYKDLSAVLNIKIPRRILISNAIKTEIHSFSDSSIVAYGVCLYMRSIDDTGNYWVRLICAKSRVAPLKVITLPRLELSAAVLLANLTNKVVSSLNCTISNIFYYSDSTIVLSWLRTEPALLKTFVANRVAEIQQLTNINHWQHVNSEENPADVISRGLLPTQQINSKLWWNGPEFLNDKHIPNRNINNWVPITELPDIKKSSIAVVVLADESLFERFSNFVHLNRIVAWCLRFKNNALSKERERKFGRLDLSELDLARRNILRVIQGIYFEEDVRHLIKYKSVKPSSKLSNLNPFLDGYNLLRVGGRISKSKCPYDKKFPFILPYESHVTRLLIEHEHKHMLHAGAQATLSSLRCVYWPLRAKSLVRKILHKCIVCFKAKPSSYQELMGDLPDFRLTEIRPFLNCGVDYAGPFYVKEVKHRNRKIIKVYLCIFVCMATKAVHLEVASDLTADTFLNVLKRFVSRRGICKNIYSDNGGSFVGANNDLARFLKALQNETVLSAFFERNEISWHFIPAKSPHTGGLWEAAVKSAKHHLKRVIGLNHLSLEDFNTLCTQVEAILNSRPLVPLSDDPNDLTPLTPGHFLIGDVLTAIPQVDVTKDSFNKLSAYNQLQQMSQHFWSRWHKEYLPHLQQRTKWKQQSRHHLKVGAMALVKEDNVPPLCWPLARVVQLHPGKDGVVRVVSLRTKGGILKRAVSRICVLPDQGN